MDNKYKAEKGKVWRSLVDGSILSDVLILGKEDSISNYDQIDEPVYPPDEDELPSWIL